jgi:long-chain acyl-CoA synthetase
MGRVGLIGENSTEYISKLIDIWNNGDCAVLIDWRIPCEKAIEMMKEAGVQNCYLESGKYDIADCYNDINFVTYVRTSNSAELLPGEIYDKFKINYRGNEAIVLYSSGTTGKAKGIILSHFALNTNADAIIDYMRPTKKDCIYIAKTLSHSSTITGELMVALKTHTRLVVAPTIVPPRFMLDSICKFAVTIICLNPTLLSIYANEHQKNHYDLSPLKTIYVSGSILNDQSYWCAHEIFGNIEIYNVYGLSEAGPRVTAQRKDCHKSNSVGKPIKGVEIIVVDDNGNEANKCEYGIIHVNTPSRFSGYITKNEKLSSLYKGWLNTGDIGYLDDNGELHIVSRIDDVIIHESHKLYPTEIENTIQKIITVNECAVVKIEQNQEVIIICFYVADKAINAKEIKLLRRYLMSYEVPKKFIQVDYIPKNRNGKRSYDDIRNLL